MADVWANSMACHPRATCHIAGCKNSIRHIENRFSPYFYYFLFVFNAVQALTSGGFRIVSDTLVTRVITINHEMKVNAGGVIVSEFDT